MTIGLRVEGETELGVLLAPGFQRRLQEPLGLHLVRGVEDRAKVDGDGFLPLAG